MGDIMMTEEEELKLLKEGREDLKWLQVKYEKLTEEYNNRFVAIRRGGILASGKTIEAVIDELKKQNEDPSTTLIEYITKDIIIF